MPRGSLDNASNRPRAPGQALIVAQLRYNPTAGCPQTRITGVPVQARKHERRTSFLADAAGGSTTLWRHVTARHAALDASVVHDEQA